MMSDPKNAYEELMDVLQPDETVEAVVFGDWGWGGYSEPDVKPVSDKYKGRVMSLEEAGPLMRGWRFNGGFGSPDCYATFVWTNKRIFFVTQYDGSTVLDWIPRDPANLKPCMFGGG